MRRSRVAIGAGVAVAGYVAYRRFRKPRARLPVHAIPFAALAATRALAFQSIDEPAINVIDHIGLFFAAVVALIPGLLQAIGEALQWLFDELARRIVEIYNWDLAVLGGIPFAFRSFSDWITNVDVRAQNFALTLFTQLRDSIVGYVTDTVFHDLGILNWAENLIYTAIQAALSTTGPFVGWLQNYVVQPVYGYVDARINALWTDTQHLVADAVRGLDGIPSWLDDHIRSIAQGLIDLAFAGIADLLDAVRGALDFLLWVGAHAIGWWEDLANQMDALLDGGILDILEKAIREDETRVDGFFDRIF